MYWRKKVPDKLIFPISASSEIKYYLSVEELCYVLYDTRIKLGHGERDRMCHELTVVIKILRKTKSQAFYICVKYANRRSGRKKRVVVKPMVFDEFNSRGQLRRLYTLTQRYITPAPHQFEF